MKDITLFLEQYRECVRHLWNSGFLAIDMGENAWDFRDEYSEIASRIFGILVLYPIGYKNVELPKEYEMYPEPFPNLYVAPTGLDLSMIINRTTPQGGYWDDVKRVAPEEAEMKFINYFDPDMLGMRDLEYYLVRITRFNEHPHLVGRSALVRVSEAKVFYSESAP